jgi:hypothetical protein
MKCIFRWAAGAALTALLAGAAHAGPVIIDGTDANDHGFASLGANYDGWLYMQKALENLANAVAPSNSKTVVVLGINPAGSSQARDAINSAFNLSSLPGAGWSISFVDTAAAITTYFSTISTSNTGILYLPTYGNAIGDLDANEMAAINANAAAINTFVGGAGNPAAGGGLFAMAESGFGAWGWLTTLIPGIIATDVGGQGIGTDISLTPAGVAAFPGLTNADLAGADPWHGYFSGNLGGLSVLGTAPDDIGVTRNLIIGGGAGTVIGCGQPGQPACQSVPEPGALPLVALALITSALAIRRRRAD